MPASGSQGHRRVLPGPLGPALPTPMGPTLGLKDRMSFCCSQLSWWRLVAAAPGHLHGVGLGSLGAWTGPFPRGEQRGGSSASWKLG